MCASPILSATTFSTSLALTALLPLLVVLDLPSDLRYSSVSTMACRKKPSSALHRSNAAMGRLTCGADFFNAPFTMHWRDSSWIL